MATRSSQVAYLAKRRAAGLCNRCAAKVDRNGSVCAACLAKQRESRASTKQAERRRRAQEVATKRFCLRCDHPFVSEGPHHRLCTTCREFLHTNPTPEAIVSFRRPVRIESAS